MSKPVNDPLEAAKVGKDTPKKSGWGNRRKAKAEAAEAAAAPVEETAPAVESSAPAVASSTPQAAPPAKKPAGVFKFKVVKTRRISRNGQLTSLKAGSIISSQHYGGMPGIEALQAGGLELEPI